MALFSSTAAAIAAITTAVGTGVATVGTIKQAEGAKKAESLRKRQMDLQVARERRQSIRQAIAARATALSNATAQGAGEGSGVQGGMAQVSNQLNQNIQGLNQSQDIGNKMFSANRTISQGQTMASIGGTIQGVGGWIADNYDVNKRVLKNAGWSN